MRIKKVQYAFWEEDSGTEGLGYWSMHDTLEAAATEAKGCRVYRLDATPLGIYKIEAQLVRVRQRKKRRSRK
jgi:hypothetical protein